MPPGSKLALAIRHVHFETCGTLEDVLLERGFTIRHVDAGSQWLQDLDLDDRNLFRRAVGCSCARLASLPGAVA